MHHAALDRTRAARSRLRSRDRRTCRGFRRGSIAHLRARFDLEHADRVGAADHLVDGLDPRAGMSCMLEAARRAAARRGRARAGSPTACRARARRLSAARALRDRPCPTGSRCGLASPRSRSARAARACPRAITKPPTCCDRCRGKPSNCASRRPRCCVMCEFADRSPLPRSRCEQVRRSSHHCCDLATARSATHRAQRLADVAQRAARAIRR